MRKFLGMLVCTLGLSGTLMRATSDRSLSEWSIVPVQYENKAFIKGEYVDIDRDFEIFTEEGTVYIPFRLLAELLSTYEESWRVNWVSNKPNEVTLDVDHMRTMSNWGWVNTGEVSPTIKLTLDSTTAFIGKEEVALSKAPKKIKGTICLPLRAISEIVGKEVSYYNGLIYIGERVFPVTNEKLVSESSQLKGFLEYEKRAVMPESIPVPLASVRGKNIYQQTYYNEQNNQNITKLYSEKVGEEPVLLKTLVDSYFYNLKDNTTKLYYVEGKAEERSLYILNLITMQETKLCKVSQLLGFDSISSLEEKGETYYAAVHYGDWTMGSESLFAIKEGNVEELVGAKQFSSILIEEDAIYYSEMSMMSCLDNLFKYNRLTGEVSSIGKSNFSYDMYVEESEEGIGGYGMCANAFIKEDKLYTLGYESGTYTAPRVYAIDLKTNEQKAITGFTTEFWLVGNQIYYKDASAKVLMSVNLDGKIVKKVVNEKVGKVIVREETLYYTFLADDMKEQLGLYAYDTLAKAVTRITDLPIKEFCVTEKGIYYLSAGYDPGLYSWESGRTDWVEESRIKYYEMNAYGVGYATVYDKESKVVGQMVTETTVTEEITPEQFLAEVRNNIQCLNECLIENFNADADFNNAFLAMYKDEESYQQGQGKPEILLKETDVTKYKQYFVDPTYSGYYPVENYKSINEVSAYLEQYMTKDIAKQFAIEEDFLEYDNTLYLIRGSRGYGAEKIDTNSLEFVGKENDIYRVKASILLFDQLDHSEILSFKNVNDHWILTAMEVEN